jgi:hypothetical protein
MIDNDSVKKYEKVTDFWDIALCSLVEIYRRFGDAFSFHLQSDHPDNGDSIEISET